MSYPEILIDSTDYDGIRSLLGVTDSDIDDDVIAQAIYGPAVELEIADTMGVTRYEDALDGDTKQLRLRIVAMDWVAAAIAATRAKGGTLGMVRPTEDDRDWDKLAKQLRDAGAVWLAKALDEDGPDQSAEYSIRLLHVSGPTRARVRAEAETNPAWWTFPPFVGIPPGWGD